MQRNLLNLQSLDFINYISVDSLESMGIQAPDEHTITYLESEIKQTIQKVIEKLKTKTNL